MYKLSNNKMYKLTNDKKYKLGEFNILSEFAVRIDSKYGAK